MHGVEEDIAEDRLQYWINRGGQTPTSHDAVDGMLFLDFRISIVVVMSTHILTSNELI